MFFSIKLACRMLIEFKNIPPKWTTRDGMFPHRLNPSEWGQGLKGRGPGHGGPCLARGGPQPWEVKYSPIQRTDKSDSYSSRTRRALTDNQRLSTGGILAHDSGLFPPVSPSDSLSAQKSVYCWVKKTAPSALCRAGPAQTRLGYACISANATVWTFLSDRTNTHKSLLWGLESLTHN